MSELGEFLRSRRERLTPAEVGLPAAGRRRTPGLRREELATLAGISIDYLVRLEQGRDTNPSASVLAALASALRLNDDEQRHLGQLALKSVVGPMCPTHRLTTDVRPTVLALLERLDPTPALVMGPLTDLVAWNAAWSKVGSPIGLAGDGQPNLARIVFLDPSARRTFVEWDLKADDVVAKLRRAHPVWGDEPAFAELLDDLRVAPEFASRWDARDLVQPRALPRKLLHPEAGPLRFVTEELPVTDEGGLTLTVFLPYDDATEQAVHALLAEPLRVVKHA